MFLCSLIFFFNREQLTISRRSTAILYFSFIISFLLDNDPKKKKRTGGVDPVCEKCRRYGWLINGSLGKIHKTRKKGKIQLETDSWSRSYKSNVILIYLLSSMMSILNMQNFIVSKEYSFIFWQIRSFSTNFMLLDWLLVWSKKKQYYVRRLVYFNYRMAVRRSFYLQFWEEKKNRLKMTVKQADPNLKWFLTLLQYVIKKKCYTITRCFYYQIMSRQKYVFKYQSKSVITNSRGRPKKIS